MKILYTPSRGIGDMIFSLPLLHSLRSAHPSAEIFLPIPNDPSKKEMHKLLGHIHRTQNYLPLPREDKLAYNRWVASAEGNRKKKLHFEKLIFEKYLSGEKYDLAIIPKPFRIDTIICEKQINESDLKSAGILEDNCHMSNILLGYASYLGIDKKKDFSLDLDRQHYSKILDDKKLFAEKDYAVFNLGASSQNKRWTTDGYTKLSRYFLSKGIIPVLIGTYDDSPQAISISCDVKGVINLVPNSSGLIDINSIALLVERSCVVVSGDTGIMHLSDAIGCNVVGLFGPTSPQKYGPYNNKENIISRYDSDKIVKNITVDETISKLEEIL